jgi:uncharacterized repeat protein (TIGR02543 family)
MASISAKGSTGKQTFTLTVTETATSNTANTSTLSYSFTIGKSDQGSWPFSDMGTDIAFSVVINGVTVKTGYIPSYDGSSTVTLASGTTTVTHNAGGAKSISYSFNVVDKYPALPGPGNASASGTMALATISVASYKLSISAGTGSTVTVLRTSSPKGGGSTGNLANGAKIYYSDVLEIKFGESTHYNLNAHTVNGSTFSSGGTHTVYDDVYVVATAVGETYTITYRANGGSGTMAATTYTYAPTGTINLCQNAFTRTGYEFLGWSKASTAAKADYTDGQAWNKSNGDNYTLYAVWKQMGLIYIDTGAELVAYTIHIDNGSGWDQYVPHIDSGSVWNLCT